MGIILTLALAACDPSGPRCEAVGGVALSIDRALYAPVQDDKTLALTLRYRDFAAPGEYDPRELGDPAWSLAGSNTATRLEIARTPGSPPKCPIGCEHVFYLNEDWSARGLGYVACEFVENRNPFLITCTAHDTIAGLQVAYTFPAAKKEQFPAFRERIAAFLAQRIAAGAQARD